MIKKLKFSLLSFLLLLSTDVFADSIEKIKKAYESADYKLAFQLSLPLAEAGDATAQNYIGVMFSKGEGVTKDFSRAFEWFSKSAHQGNPKAQYNLAVSYEQGEGTPQDRAKALTLYKIAAENGNPDAQVDYGWALFDGVDITKDEQLAKKMVMASADQLCGRGELALGQFHYFGYARLPRNREKAIEYSLRAAEHGSPLGHLFVASIYLEKNELPRNPGKALELLKSMARNASRLDPEDTIMVQRMIAKIYQDGDGVEKNIVKSYAWWRLIHDNPLVRSYAWSMFSQDLPIDLSSLEEKYGLQEVTSNVSFLESLMTPSQLKEAENIIKKCKATGNADC